MVRTFTLMLAALAFIATPSLVATADGRQPLPQSRIAAPVAQPFMVASTASCRKACQAAYDKCANKCTLLNGPNSTELTGCQEVCYQDKVDCRKRC